MNTSEFDISKYIAPTDIAAAVSAGVVAYIKNSGVTDDQQPPQAGQTVNQQAEVDPTVHIDHGRVDIQDPNMFALGDANPLQSAETFNFNGQSFGLNDDMGAFRQQLADSLKFNTSFQGDGFLQIGIKGLPHPQKLAAALQKNPQLSDTIRQQWDNVFKGALGQRSDFKGFRKFVEQQCDNILQAG